MSLVLALAHMIAADAVFDFAARVETQLLVLVPHLGQFFIMVRIVGYNVHVRTYAALQQ